MDETKTKKASPIAAMVVGFFLSLLFVAPIVVLLTYFSGFPEDLGAKFKNEYFLMSFGISVLISFILALIFTAYAVRKPKESD